jgi:succinate-acetate transporter protein
MMTVNNPPKLWLLVLVLVGLFTMLAIGKVTTDQALPIISAIVGYGIGNGIASRNGESVEPVFKQRPAPQHRPE